jgi:pimeloyl-ACP methyl ester carboxylesterase
MSTNTAFQPTAHKFTSQGLELSYVDWGNPDAPLLLLIHGMRDHARSWDWTARALRDRWHVVAPDLRGHGDSAWSVDAAYLAAYQVLDLADLIDRFGERPVVLVAHSFGANMAARYSAMFPGRVSKLVIVDGMGPGAEVVAKWAKDGPIGRSREWLEKRRENARRKPRYFASIEEAAQRMAATNPRLSHEQAYHLALHGVRKHPGGYTWKFDPNCGAFLPEDFSIDLAGFWREITIPTLLCYGPESWTTNPETSGRAAFFRDRRTVVFEGAGHWIHHDKLDQFVATLHDFLG